jgi:hypothetical protein
MAATGAALARYKQCRIYLFPSLVRLLPACSRNQRTIFVESLFNEDAEKMKDIVAKAIEVS